MQRSRTFGSCQNRRRGNGMNLSRWQMGVVLLVALIMLVGVWMMQKRRGAKVNQSYYMEKWVALQKHCVSRKTWPLAIIEADNLLDEALKSKGFKGKTTGERLV